MTWIILAIIYVALAPVFAGIGRIRFEKGQRVWSSDTYSGDEYHRRKTGHDVDTGFIGAFWPLFLLYLIGCKWAERRWRNHG